MDFRILIAVALALVVLLLAWFVVKARGSRARLAEEADREWEESDRIASERLGRLAAARRERGEFEPQEDRETSGPETAGIVADTDEIGDDEEDWSEPRLVDRLPEPSFATDVEAAPDPTRWTAIVEPIVPVTRGDPRRSWVGGRPHLPQNVNWPEADGQQLVFLAAICLEDLPADVWPAQAVRTGWMHVFLNADTHAVHCMHISEIGSGEDEQPNALPEGFRWFAPFGQSGSSIESRIPRRFGEWPVALTLRPEQRPEGSQEARNGPTHGHEIQNYNFADPALYPVDEFSMVALLDAINDDFARLMDTRYENLEQELADGAAEVERARRDLTAALEAEEPDQEAIGPLRAALAKVEELHRTLAEEAEINTAAQSHLLEISEVVRQHAGRKGLTPTDIAQIVEGITLVPIAWRVQAGPEGEEKTELVQRPLTQVAIGDQLPGSSMIPVAFEHMKQAYTQRPEALTPEQRMFWEKVFVGHASPLGKIGGAPTEAGAEFDSGSEVLLLEIESSPLVGWRFGENGRLLITLQSTDLAAGDFSKARMQISNG